MTPHPIKLRFRKADKVLRAEFDNDETFDIPFELLRVESPSAEVQGHGGQRPPPVTGKADIGVERAEPVGQYAIRIVFDDGHDSGFFTWSKLYDFGKNSEALMAAYRRRVAEHAA
ncbi:MAG: hypothetical protein CMK06_01295 [Ponticaulis sp.]|nr:hypothetical protein [Ponticaulis sp.]|tara:strand:+ start:40 stop:384 length:345 start_codon:yes stop_codon:yes gene_type:complete